MEIPNIICPYNITKRLPPGEETVSIQFEPMALSDNSNETLEVNSTYPSGYEFPHGVYEVTLSAMDKTGNVGECVFEVRIQEGEF